MATQTVENESDALLVQQPQQDQPEEHPSLAPLMKISGSYSCVQPEPPSETQPVIETHVDNKISPEVAALANVINSALNTFPLQAADVWIQVPSANADESGAEMCIKYLFGLHKDSSLSMWGEMSPSMTVPLSKSFPGRIISSQGF